MTEHLITPPLELVEKWFLGAKANPPNQWVTDVAAQAARWGADQELQACIAALEKDLHLQIGDLLLAARRSKPPSLKQQALERCSESTDPDGIIRRALEQLPD